MVRRTLRIMGMEAVRELLSPEQFLHDMSLIHRQLALKSLGLLILTCSVDTGRARAGFTALFSRHGYSYSKYAAQSLASGPVRRTPPQGRSAAAEAEGRAASSVVEAPLSITLTNAVEYVEYINSGTAHMAGTRFIDIGLDRTLLYAQFVMDWYAERIKAGARGQIRGDPDENPAEIA